MAKNKETVPEILDEEIREEEQPSVKGPLRDDPEPAYTPAWQVVNRRQDIYSDVFPPKIYSLDALLAAGIVTDEMLADGGYVKNTDYASGSVAGVVKASAGNGLAVSGTGQLAGNTFTNQGYTTSAGGAIICKGTLENIKEDLSARGLVGIAAGQYAEPTAGTYTVKLTYDGTAWGVTITQDT